jgi:hypothetical protein
MTGDAGLQTIRRLDMDMVKYRKKERKKGKLMIFTQGTFNVFCGGCVR